MWQKVDKENKSNWWKVVDTKKLIESSQWKVVD